MAWVNRLATLTLVIGGLAPTGALALDKVTFGTNWLAEAEHGGFYQAIVDGTYAKYGLDVTLLPGGPQVDREILLPSGKLDFYVGGNMLQAYSAVEQHVPIVVVAGFFQKEPQCILSHPGVGLDTFESLKTAPIFIGKEGLTSFYRWMVSQYGFSEDMVKPYTYNTAPFIADKKSAQQGYATSEPYAVETQGGFKPNVFLLADNGFSTYSTTIETRSDLVEKNPDLVQRFVDASAIGWYNYLYGDPAKANEAIKKDNPDITDKELGFARDTLKRDGIVDSGGSLQDGIGAMSDSRQKDFFDKMVKAGVTSPDIDYKKSYTLQFVNKKVGLDLRPKN
ncbi:ABC transporter substrate-binding protein [Lichenihabitans psoromatis]|uniref:ABC transporter substrate-binding protein n=1 Tax=Lichenihabitans psoromatis TaxID=2528642 RepID=UPI0010383FB8|nr:ABC transporter substrate-binding protein [Lichenihabitans psoromatis]